MSMKKLEDLYGAEQPKMFMAQAKFEIPMSVSDKITEFKSLIIDFPTTVGGNWFEDFLLYMSDGQLNMAPKKKKKRFLNRSTNCEYIQLRVSRLNWFTGIRKSGAMLGDLL